MKISYAITVCDEYEEIQRLLNFLFENIRNQDEIVVLVDLNKNQPTSPLLGYLHKLSSKNSITLLEDKFRGDFSFHKNLLNNSCKGEFLFQLDADEIPHINLIKSLPLILENNVDLIWVPRINTVDNIGLSHVRDKWGWSVSKLESMIEEKEFDLNNPQDLDEYNLLKGYDLIIKETFLE